MLTQEQKDFRDKMQDIANYLQREAVQNGFTYEVALIETGILINELDSDDGMTFVSVHIDYSSEKQMIRDMIQWAYQITDNDDEDIDAYYQDLVEDEE